MTGRARILRFDDRGRERDSRGRVAYLGKKGIGKLRVHASEGMVSIFALCTFRRGRQFCFRAASAPHTDCLKNGKEGREGRRRRERGLKIKGTERNVRFF